MVTVNLFVKLKRLIIILQSHIAFLVIYSTIKTLCQQLEFYAINRINMIPTDSELRVYCIIKLLLTLHLLHLLSETDDG